MNSLYKQAIRNYQKFFMCSYFTVHIGLSRLKPVLQFSFTYLIHCLKTFSFYKQIYGRIGSLLSSIIADLALMQREADIVPLFVFSIPIYFNDRLTHISLIKAPWSLLPPSAVELSIYGTVPVTLWTKGLDFNNFNFLTRFAI